MYPALGRYAIVISDAVKDYAPEVTMLDELLKTLRSSPGHRGSACSGLSPRQVDGSKRSS